MRQPTFNELPAICLTRIDLDSYLMALEYRLSATRVLVNKCMLDIYVWSSLTVDSLRSLIGMPIVEVMVAAEQRELS